MKQVLGPLEYYSRGRRISIFGSGAIIPHLNNVTQCLALNGNILSPEVYGLDTALALYSRVLPLIRFGQQCRLCNFQRYVTDFAAIHHEAHCHCYSIALLFVHSVPADLPRLADRLFSKSQLPITYVIVCTGGGPSVLQAYREYENAVLKNCRLELKSSNGDPSVHVDRDCIKVIDLQHVRSVSAILDELPTHIAEIHPSHRLLPSQQISDMSEMPNISEITQSATQKPQELTQTQTQARMKEQIIKECEAKGKPTTAVSCCRSSR
jgi:hypothetical protein